MAESRIQADESTIERLLAHLHNGETYDAFLNALLDYLEGTSVALPWPRLPKATWEAMRAAAKVEVKGS